jgi:hypothetical protein
MVVKYGKLVKKVIGQTKDQKNVFSPLCMQYKEVRGQTDWNQDYVSVR